ncbi:MAG TPA: glycosyltransferase [archaeon]|nr:glycosyltransferase [archaeon]
METLNFLITTAFYPPNHIGGDAVFSQYLAEELVKQGHEVHVMTSVDAYRLKKGRRLKKETQDSGVVVHRLKSPADILSPLSAYVFGSSHYYTYQFSELVHKLKPDVVHHHNISLLGHQLLKRQGPYVSIHTTHDFWLICPIFTLTTKNGERCSGKRCALCALSHRKFPQFWRYSQSFKNEINDLDIIISPSQFFARIQEEVLQRRIVHIPNFVPYPPMSSSGTDFSDYFLFAGRVDRRQGIQTLLDIFSDEDIHRKLLVVGTGNLSGYLTEFVKRKGLQNKITYLGWVSNEELHSLYRGALATISPIDFPANFPLVALESISNGTAVIGSDNGGLSEIVEKVDEKLIYKSASELKQILSTFDKSKYPSKLIKAIYEKYYSPEVFLKRYLESIKSFKSN